VGVEISKGTAVKTLPNLILFNLAFLNLTQNQLNLKGNLTIRKIYSGLNTIMTKKLLFI